MIRPTGLEAMLKSIAHTLVSQYTVTITREINTR